MPASLASTFYASYRVAGPHDDADGAMQEALEAICRQGREAWPGLSIDETRLAAYLGDRAPEGQTPLSWLGELRPGDMALACACTIGVPGAVRAFDAAFLSKVDVYLSALRPTEEVVRETQQQLREKLFVGASGESPKIATYKGRGSLEGWVRISAVRTALNLIQAEKAEAPEPNEADELARVMLPVVDPELDLVRASCEAEFIAAFREAIASLSQRERGLLRSSFILKLTPGRIGIMYGVHRTTAMRWIDSAQEAILTHTRTRMIERLNLSPSDCDQVVALVRHRLSMSISSLLRTPS